MKRKGLGSNAFSIGVICVFAVFGASIAPFIAAELVWWRATLGGALLGAFGGFATVLNRLLLD
jgi:hypothetical protein